ncbi:hypothetical protein GGR06_000614 [Bacteroides reticulotermitis]|uniref:Uncharacterized protein n=1 Tax=Bacteroides reticulotermitis TaxID=1133319 RepID=A0A840CW97_9BACE|nr:hypothetical protein [Bacteroides reticulotermitis]
MLISGFGDEIRNIGRLHGYCIACKKSRSLSSAQENRGGIGHHTFAGDPNLLVFRKIKKPP